MLTDNELLEEMIGEKNLKLTYQQLYRNKGASGVNGIEIKALK